VAEDYTIDRATRAIVDNDYFKRFTRNILIREARETFFQTFRLIQMRNDNGENR
jgi:hypothetical protein